MVLAPQNNFSKSQAEGGMKHSPFNIDIKSGIASHFKDILKLRNHDQPEIEVCEPTKKGSHHEYKMKGGDHQGQFEVWRRYNHFFELRVIMYQRFLGLYVPPIPEKKKLVNYQTILTFENRATKITQQSKRDVFSWINL